MSDKLIVALDYSTTEEAQALVNCLGERVSFYKIGPQIACLPDGIAFARNLKEQGKRVFLDLKLHDVPSIVETSTRQIARLGVDVLSILGYPQDMRAAADGRRDSELQIFGITVLTSDTEETTLAAGYTVTMRSILGQRTDYAVTYGIDGLICTASESKLIKSWSRNHLKTMSPAIRLDSNSVHDQHRTATPETAIKLGVDYIIVGRPITRSCDPCHATDLILASMVA